jgi:transposase
MTFVATEIELTADERAKLGRLCGAATSQQREVFRARIVLLAGDGVPTREIARRLGTTPVTVSKWRLRFQALGVLGLTDQDRPGKPPTYGHDDRMRVFETAVGDPPEGHTHWSVRTLAQAVCMGKTRVHEILEEAELRPHQVRSWLTSIDPDFQAKQTEVCGLYLNPPDNAIVISVDEKTGVQAKEPVRETKPMQVGTPERREFEYRRHGTQALLAALLVHTGEVMGQVYDRHTRVEFLDFLEHLEREIPHGKDVHVVLDNLQVHKTKEVTAWLEDHPRWQFHFTPTHASWLNQIELWFSILSRRLLRRGVFTSQDDLNQQLTDFIARYNQTAKPFAWTYAGKPLTV